MPYPFVGFCNPFYARNIISRSKKSSIVHVLGKEIFSSIYYQNFRIKLGKYDIEGEENKSLQNILVYIAKVINPRVKSQARGKNNKSIALK